MKLTYSLGSTILVSAGEVVVSNSAGDVRLMLNNTSSTNVTFADIDTGAEANSTYYVYAIAATSASETATFKISLNSTAPDSVTYYKRLGSFDNVAGDIDEETIVNDNHYYKTVLGSGTVAHGGTISLPSGISSEDDCSWIIAGLINTNGSGSYGWHEMYYRISSGRVAECRSKDCESGSWRNGSCNYLIICNE
ncbi:MAG: hypothetical protein U9O94_01350 [Nanoarchaeota archaeon]|nr:hypothetical protein [Nanoarchaeota archaeon]